VDDCPYLADALALLLNWWGYQTAVAYDGPAALAAALIQPPDAVLLDLGLPGMDGYEVARRLRGQPHMEKALLVALTGHGLAEDVCRCRAAGFDLHLLKPCEPDDLHRVLDERLAAQPTPYSVPAARPRSRAAGQATDR
jgi:CheY-like chemotaxis protein